MLFTSSKPQLTATFPGQHSVVRPGDTLDLTAHLALEVDAKGQPKMQRVTAELRGTQMTTYYRSNGNHTERRTEETILLSQIQTIWTPDQTHVFEPSSAASSSTSVPTIDIPVHLQFPHIPLPPSFQGGSRSAPLLSGRRQIDGHDVARVVYFVKLHGVKAATFTVDDRIVLPFIYAPAAVFRRIPNTLVFATQADSVSAPPPPPTVAQGWATLALDHRYREKLLTKKSMLTVAFSGPSVDSIPIGMFYPFRLSFLTLSPPVSTNQFPTPMSDSKGWSRSPPADSPVELPDLAKVELGLERTVYTQARGRSQTYRQLVGPAYAVGIERRVWYGAPRLLSMDEYAQRTGSGGRGCKPGETRWAVEIVVVGEMLLGKGPTQGISSSFGPDVTRGLLTCSYHLSLRVPCKGMLSTLHVDPFLPVVLSPQPHTIGAPPEQSDAPPDYFDVTSGSGTGFDDAKAS